MPTRTRNQARIQAPEENPHDIIDGRSPTEFSYHNFQVIFNEITPLFTTQLCILYLINPITYQKHIKKQESVYACNTVDPYHKVESLTQPVGRPPCGHSHEESCHYIRSNHPTEEIPKFKTFQYVHIISIIPRFCSRLQHVSKCFKWVHDIEILQEISFTTVVDIFISYRIVVKILYNNNIFPLFHNFFMWILLMR